MDLHMVFGDKILRENAAAISQFICYNTLHCELMVSLLSTILKYHLLGVKAFQASKIYVAKRTIIVN